MTEAFTPPLAELERRFRLATTRAFGAGYEQVDPLVRRSDRADFQGNLAMSLGKLLKRPPRDVAQALVSALDSDDIVEKLEVAGPGFINITLKNAYLDRLLAAMAADARLGVTLASVQETVIVD
jgi:arginyl-tRNA synthetase